MPFVLRASLSSCRIIAGCDWYLVLQPRCGTCTTHIWCEVRRLRCHPVDTLGNLVDDHFTVSSSASLLAHFINHAEQRTEYQP
jgi:putative component of membrane protein insertase Oxa1/YidC/SpoIIIJ protein YidD